MRTITPIIVGAVASLLALGTMAEDAHATAVTGLIDFTGSNTYSTTTDLLHFINPASVTSDTGTLATFGSCGDCATFKDIQFGSGFHPQANEIVAVNGANTFALDINTLKEFSFTDFLSASGKGVLHLTGFQPTEGDYFFSTQGPQNVEVSFSATAVATPEPAGLAVLGVGLLGLGLVYRRARA